MNPRENAIERDARVLRLYERLVEIEQRLIPTGLHVFGRAAAGTKPAFGSVANEAASRSA